MRNNNNLYICCTRYNLLVYVNMLHEQSYICEHDHYLCTGLDLVGLGHGYGLPHLPIMPELKDKDLSQFTPHTTPPSRIPYRDKTRERKRKLLLQQPGERERERERRGEIGSLKVGRGRA